MFLEISGEWQSKVNLKIIIIGIVNAFQVYCRMFEFTFLIETFNIQKVVYIIPKFQNDLFMYN